MTPRIFMLRVEIDACDRMIAEALARRSRAVVAIRAEKLDVGAARRDGEREANITRAAIAMQKAAHGRYDEQTISRVYAAIFDGCERLTEAAVSHPVDGGCPRAPG